MNKEDFSGLKERQALLFGENKEGQALEPLGAPPSVFPEEKLAPRSMLPEAGQGQEKLVSRSMIPEAGQGQEEQTPVPLERQLPPLVFPEEEQG
ncbi:hypothetical protein KFL_016590010, partial [Klebsormidium nitens]